MTIAAGAAQRTVTVVETIALGHKFALHGIAAGRRVRKYGECIGRMTHAVAAGAWVHVHNLATTATRTDADEHAWRMQAAPAGGTRALPGAPCADGASPVYDAQADRHTPFTARINDLVDHRNHIYCRRARALQDRSR